jgi:3-deoxy-D-manno-octulosonate 8-phosphate phosphatase (KDO 8-P phosphatase)
MATNKTNKIQIKPRFFIVDVDGVLTDGKFVYTSQGKISKTFGPDDNDALCLLKKYMTIHMVSGDKRGYEITKKRIIDDMHFPLDLVSTFERVEWIKSHYNLSETIYMGDGIFDSMVFSEVGYGIAPANAFYIAKEHADFVTKNKGGEGAVAEACLYIMDKFFEPFDPLNAKLKKDDGVWGK